MELCTQFCVLFFGLILFLSCFHLYECRKLTGYDFAVYSTKTCPRTQTEWNERSSAINCTMDNGYMCLPNDNITELLEFCYINSFILIQEDICLFLSKQFSAVDSYNCTGFLSGCPNTSHYSYKLFEKPECTSIGNGCFLAEPSCQSLTATVFLLDDTDNIKLEKNKDMVLVGTTFGVFIITCIICYLVINNRKGIRICRKHDDQESHKAEERFPFLSQNHYDVKKSGDKDRITAKDGSVVQKDDECTDDLPLDQALIEQWQEDSELFVKTNASNKVESLVHSQNIVLVTGHTGSGKSSILHHIALEYRSQGWKVKPVYTVTDMIKIINSSKSVLDNTILFVLNDPIGKESFDEIEYTTWRKYEDSLKAYFKKAKLLMSCKKYILNDDKVKGLLKDDSIIVDISNDQLKLTKIEKENIFQRYTLDEDVPRDELTEIVETEAYFPLLCKLCYRKKIKAHEKLKLFTKPVIVLEDEINNFRKSFKTQYCALVLLVLFNNDLCVADIQESTISSEKYSLALKLSEMKKTTEPHTIGDACETLQGFFVKKIIDNYHFYHDFVMEVTSYVIGNKYPLQIIKYADLGFLRKNVKLKCINDNSDQLTISLSDKYIEALGKRLFNDIFGERLLDVVLNPSLKSEKIIDIFINELKHHPEKVKMLLKKQKLHIDTQEIIQRRSNHLFLSKLVFVSLEEKVSPLSAIIIYCDARLSLYCLQALQPLPEHFIGNSLLSSVCCNGSKDIFDMFLEEHIRKSLTEKWKFLFPIHIASAFNNKEIVCELLRNGADVNLKTANENNWTSLCLAAENDTDENESLLSNEANTSSCNEFGASPLNIACQHGHENIAQILLRNGADINLCNAIGASPFLIACQQGLVNIVHLLQKNGANINLCMKNGVSPLHTVCQQGHESIVQHLLNNGAEINPCNSYGESPLYLACQQGFDNIVKVLTDNRADINLCNKKGASPFFKACQNGHSSIVQLLLNNGATINACMETGVSPLQIACQHGHVRVVDILLRNGAAINSCNDSGATPLHIACQHGHVRLVQLILNFGADINFCNENGACSLHIACQHEHVNIVQLLISNGANINLCMKSGVSPLYIGCQQGHFGIVRLLLSKGANINPCMKNGVSPFHVACQQGHDSIVSILLSNGADINSINEHGASPLFIACQNGHYSTVQLLLRKGANINLGIKNGDSPLHIARQNKLDSVVQLLLNSGADANACK